MANQKDNLAELAKLGVTVGDSKVEGVLPLKGDESAKQVADILKATKAVLKKSGSSSQSNELETEGKTFIWLKSNAYISETQRVKGGLYMLAEVPARLAKLPADACEMFVNEIPPRKLTAIAKWSGVTHTEDFNDDELLAKIVLTELKPF